MHNLVEEIWINAEEACSLLNISRETFRRNCKSGKYISKSKKQGKSVQYSVLVSSLPAEAQDKYFSKEDQEDKTLDIEIYSNAPAWAKAKADKYLLLFDETEGLKGAQLRVFLENWNKTNPELKASYASFMEAKKKYETEGVSALLAGYGHNKGKSIVSDEYFEYFKSLYLKERGPSIKSCWRTVLGYAKRKYGVMQKDFPSLFSFKRRLKFEIPEQAIYLARYGEAAWNRKYIDLLVIDDLGKEQPTSWSTSVINQIINLRYQSQKPIIVTLEKNVEYLRTIYGEAIPSRLYEMCVLVDMQRYKISFDRKKEKHTKSFKIICKSTLSYAKTECNV